MTIAPHQPIERRVVGSASIWVLGRVAGGARAARVLYSDENAVYVDLEGFCLGVLGARAIQVPCGVRTQLPTLTTVEVGSEAVVEDGGVVFGDTEVLVTNIVDTTVPVLAPEVAARCGRQLGDLAGDRLQEARDALSAEHLDLLAAGDAAAVAGLLGVGPGMTPVGDDVLSGWLAAGVSSRHPRLAEVRAAVALSASERTTPLAATLLACAARGEGVPEFRSLLLGLVNEHEEHAAQALDLMLGTRRGTAGGLVLGALLALSAARG